MSVAPLQAGLLESRREFWTRHLAWPLCLLGLAASASMAFGWDQDFAAGLFFDPVTREFLGAGTGSWWARDLLHHGGRNLIRTVGAAATIVWLGSYFVPGWTRLRRLAAYVALSLIVSAALVEALKYATNTDCPRDLLDFGGVHPHVALLQWRPSTLPRAMCFPGAHAASGFSLLALFHAAASYRNRHDWRWLLPGLLLGTVFAFAQEARGAHFLSHDLTGAAVAWAVVTVLAALMLEPPGERFSSVAARTRT